MADSQRSGARGEREGHVFLSRCRQLGEREGESGEFGLKRPIKLPVLHRDRRRRTPNAAQIPILPVYLGDRIL
jgi:hypothetical protein